MLRGVVLGQHRGDLEAAQDAAAAGARMVVLSSGGELAELAATWDAPHVELPDIPMPRAGIGAVSIPPLLVLERVGLFPGAAQYVADAVDQLKRRRRPADRRRLAAHRLAEAIGRTMPVTYGGDALGDVAAYRFKCQVNENAKAPGVLRRPARAVPQRDLRLGPARRRHPPGDDGRQLPPRLRAPAGGPRFDLTYDVLDEVVHAVTDVGAEGEGALAQLFDLVLQGDFVSLHLAAQAGVDPGPDPRARGPQGRPGR